MNLLFLFMTILPIVYSFTVIPYIQIDYAHYFRLAQCQAKCQEKYGSMVKIQLLDGTFHETNADNEDNGRMCELGCSSTRHSHRRKTSRSVNNHNSASLHDGARFWAESHADSAIVGTSPISKIQLLCQNPSIVDEMEDTVEGLIGLSQLRPSGPVKYLMQWKQRTYALGVYDETQWITVSIESDTSFKVDGMIPGVQYKFMVTAVGPNGRLGDTVTSEWAEIPSVGTTRNKVQIVNVKSGYNSEDGVLAQLNWQRTSYDSCYYRMQIRNSSSEVEKIFTLDSSTSILLSHLEFDAHYSISLHSLTPSKESDKMIITNSIQTEFKAFECKKVHGKGSLQCAPDSISDLKVVVRSNGTVLVSWTASSEVDNILTYQLIYQAITAGCDRRPNHQYLSAATTSTALELSSLESCEYVIKVINYDLLGREAASETRFMVTSTLGSFIQWEFILISLLFCLLLLLVAVIRCCCITKCPVRVSEDKSQKLTDSYC